MHLSSTFLVLLLLAWTEQGTCTVCNGNPLTNEKKELFALYDKIEAAVFPLLPTKEIQDLVHNINEKLKTRLCNIPIEGKAMQEVIKAGNEILNKALKKNLDINEVTAFLMKSVVENLDKMVSTLMKKPNNKPQLGIPNF